MYSAYDIRTESIVRSRRRKARSNKRKGRKKRAGKGRIAGEKIQNEGMRMVLGCTRDISTRTLRFWT